MGGMYSRIGALRPPPAQQATTLLPTLPARPAPPPAGRYLPNLVLKPLPLSEAQQQAYEKTGFLRELVFKTAPSVSKVGALRRHQLCFGPHSQSCGWPVCSPWPLPSPGPLSQR